MLTAHSVGLGCVADRLVRYSPTVLVCHWLGPPWQVVAWVCVCVCVLVCVCVCVWVRVCVCVSWRRIACWDPPTNSQRSIKVKAHLSSPSGTVPFWYTAEKRINKSHHYQSMPCASRGREERKNGREEIDEDMGRKGRGFLRCRCRCTEKEMKGVLKTDTERGNILILSHPNYVPETQKNVTMLHFCCRVAINDQ